MPASRLVLAPVLTIVAIPPSVGAHGPHGHTLVENPTSPTDEQVFKTFQSWLEKQSGPVTDLEADYRKVLASEGLPAEEIDRRLRVIVEQFQKSEKATSGWDGRVSSGSMPRNPNACLS